MRWNLDNSVNVYVDSELTGIFPAMSSEVLDARNGWEGKGYGLYIKAKGGTTMMSPTEEILDVTAVNVSLAYAKDFDADTFLALAAGGSTTPDAGTTDTAPADTEPTGTTPSETKPADTTPTDTEPSTTGTTEDGTTDQGTENEAGGCASSASCGAIVGILVVAAVLPKFRRKED